MKKRFGRFFSIIPAIVLLLYFPAWSVPPYLNYQGMLTNLDGNPLDGAYEIKFLLYNAATGGILEWSEQQTVVVTDGVYNVELGKGTALNSSDFNNDTLFLEIQIYNADTASWEILTPRQQLTSTAYAMKAANSAALEGQPAANFASSTHYHSASQINSGVLADARIPANIARDSEITWSNLAGIPAGFADGNDDIGIATETDPTVTPSIKDGVSWDEIAGIPAGFADGTDNVGLTSESDPKVGAIALWGVPRWNGSALITSSIYNILDFYQGYLTGIGTSTPESKLHISAGTSGDAHLILEADTDNNNESDQAFIELRQDGSLVKGGFGFDATENDLKIQLADSNQTAAIKFFTGNLSSRTERMSIKSSGEVNVGTDAKNISMYTYGSLVDLKSNGSALAINYSGNNTLLNVSAGSVGIGTSSPEAKLHVNGDTKFNVGGGSIAVTTPGGWPGLIAYSPNGNRRDVQFYNDFMCITMSNSPSPSSNTNGIRIYETGNVSVKVLQITGGSDLSEEFDVRAGKADLALSPGMVVSIDPENAGDLMVSSEPYDRKVAGIISGAGGVKPGMLMGQKGSVADGTNPVALTGRVYCWVDAANGAVEPGDLLTTSKTPGHAMKVTNYARAQGAILGKAMSALDRGRGLVLVLVSLQ